MKHLDYLLSVGIVAGSTVAAGAVILAQTIVEGANSSTVATGAIFTMGSAVVVTLWKYIQAHEDRLNQVRRHSDELVQAELERLRERVDELTADLIETLREDEE